MHGYRLYNPVNFSISHKRRGTSFIAMVLIFRCMENGKWKKRANVSFLVFSLHKTGVTLSSLCHINPFSMDQWRWSKKKKKEKREKGSKPKIESWDRIEIRFYYCLKIEHNTPISCLLSHLIENMFMCMFILQFMLLYLMIKPFRIERISIWIKWTWCWLCGMAICCL